MSHERWRSCLQILATVAIGGCGPNDVPIGAHRPPLPELNPPDSPEPVTELFVSPFGSDDADGSLEDPFGSIDFALTRRESGQSIVLLPGEYNGTTTGLLNVDCSATQIDGEPEDPIVVGSQTPQAAVLQGDGDSVPLRLVGCSHWEVSGLTLLNQDSTGAPEARETGSTAVIEDSSDITLSRILAAHPNRERHAHILRIDASSRVTVVEWEAYDYHQNAFEVVRSDHVTLRRNYIHSRGQSSPTTPPEPGEVALWIEESRDTVVENNVVEFAITGLRIRGRPANGSRTLPFVDVTNNRVFGNIVRQTTGPAYRIQSRCANDLPCPSDGLVVADTLLENNLALECGTALAVDAAIGLEVTRLSSVSCNSAVRLFEHADSRAIESQVAIRNAVASGFTGAAFSAVDTDEWEFSSCVTHGTVEVASAYNPFDEHVVDPLAAGDGPFGCLLYRSEDSVLADLGQSESVGAEILYRYQDGELTSEPLWAPSGVFPCGAAIGTINDPTLESCVNVHTRVGLGTPECPNPVP